jgi:hypothetical protein
VCARKLCLASCMVVIFLFAAACGGASSPASTSTSGKVENAARGGGGKLPVTTCVDAKVSVGRGAGEVRFAVACRASARGGRVGFSVGRRHLGRFSHHPSVRGPGAERRYGSCTRRLKEIIDCQSRINGKAEIVGMIAVNPKTRCSEDISVTVIEPSECNRNACPEGAVVRQMSKGLPAGC